MYLSRTWWKTIRNMPIQIDNTALIPTASVFYCFIVFHLYINMCKTIKKTGYKKGHIQLLHIHLWQEDNITYLWSTSNNLWNYQNKNKHVINQHTNVFANRRQSEQNGNNECNVPCKGMKEYKHLTVWKEKKPAN